MQDFLFLKMGSHVIFRDKLNLRFKCVDVYCLYLGFVLEVVLLESH